MTFEEILNRLIETFPDAGLAADEMYPTGVIRIPPESLPQVALMLRDDPDLAFDCCMCVSGLEILDH